ncbi:hypothetical protein ZIOFF_050083 [Zingiber officinale]|uniref:Uncharacterized protein n=1 Tax=Zingiber officinale TaxID=94328 RepID=A0A8J5FG94_ZINOF|nr:hypothetical protein ZIOFF_050083 [Zingiber officinale]
MDGVKAEDFFAYGLWPRQARQHHKQASFNIRVVNVNTIPGLNTLGVSMAQFREDGAGEGAREGVDELVVREMEDVESRQGAKEVGNRPCEGSIDGGKVDESNRGSDVLGEAPGGEREIV